MLLYQLLLFEKNVEKSMPTAIISNFICPKKSPQIQKTSVLALRELESIVSSLETWSLFQLVWVWFELVGRYVLVSFIRILLNLKELKPNLNRFALSRSCLSSLTPLPAINYIYFVPIRTLSLRGSF